MKKSDQVRPMAQILIAVLFGLIIFSGGTQLFLSPERVAGWIKDRLPHYDNLQVEFTKAQISFSGSLFPLFGIKVKDIRINFQDCETSLQLNSQYVLIPFSLTKALQKKVELGYFKAGDVDLQVLNKENICVKSDDRETASVKEQVKEQGKKLDVLLKKKNFDEIFTQLKKPFHKFKGMKIKKLSVYLPKDKLSDWPSRALEEVNSLESAAHSGGGESGESTSSEKLQTINSLQEAKKVEAQRLRLTYDKRARSILLSGGFKVLQPGFSDFAKLPLIRLDIDANEEKGLKLESEIQYHEGRFYVNSAYQKNLENLSYEWKAENFPLSFFIRSLNLEEHFARINPHLVWLYGQGLVTVDAIHDFETKLYANAAHLKGDLINVKANDVNLSLRPEIQVLKPFEWRLEKLDLEQISDYLNHKGVQGVLRKAGQIRGLGKMSAFNQVEFNGSLKKLEFFFSKGGQRAYQKIQRASMFFNFSPKEVLLAFDHIHLVKGDIDGRTSFKITKDAQADKWKQWEFLAEGNSLKFNKNVYDIFDFKPLPFKDFKIKVLGQHKDVASIQASASAPKFKTRWGQFYDMSFDLNSMEPEILKLKINSQAFDIDQDYINLAGVIDADSLQKVNIDLDIDLESEQSKIVFISKDPKDSFRLKSEMFDIKNGFEGTLIKAGQSFEVQGDTKKGYKLKTPKTPKAS